jgi:hypothetical protein
MKIDGLEIPDSVLNTEPPQPPSFWSRVRARLAVWLSYFR